MTYPHTKIPNILFDVLLSNLTEAELKILLIIIRQTYGWIDKNTGTRKIRDRISNTQFVAKTGLSRRAVSMALKSLINKGLINITCTDGSEMNDSIQRQGKSFLYYSTSLCKIVTQPMQAFNPTCAKSAHNKRNYSKENITKERYLPIRQNRPMSIGEIIRAQYPA